MITSMDIYDISEQLATLIYDKAITEGIKEDGMINYSFSWDEYPGTYDKDYAAFCIENMANTFELIQWNDNECTLIIDMED